MLSELVQLSFDKIMQTRAYTVVVLGNSEKKFAIYTDPSIGRTLQLFLTDMPKPRPLTHDLINMIFAGYEVRVKQIVIYDLQETIYYAKLFLESDEADGIRHIVEVDARPSDCISLALTNGAPVFCTRKVFEETIAIED